MTLKIYVDKTSEVYTFTAANYTLSNNNTLTIECDNYWRYNTRIKETDEFTHTRDNVLQYDIKGINCVACVKGTASIYCKQLI